MAVSGAVFIRGLAMTFHVTYASNGSDGGSVPVDPTGYNAGDNVPIQPTGSISKTGATFAYWNTAADGSGTYHGWPKDTSFSMPANDVTLYAQWFVSTGLPGGGATAHYAFSYDSTLSAGGLEPGRTLTLLNKAEADYAIMQSWFHGVTPAGSTPIKVYVTALNGGANNTGDIRLKPNTTSPNELRCFLVSEVTESFMYGQGKGWGFLPGVNNEMSCGEALSLFLTQQFALLEGFPNPYSGFTANTSNGWLNSSLPSSNPASTRFQTSGGTTTDFGSRFDYVNSTLPYPGNGPGTGGSMLFIYWLYHQLGFTIPQIITAAPGYTMGHLNATAPLRGVYSNLTGDLSDPFPYFKQWLDITYPTDQVSSIGGTNPDDPWPIASLHYWGVKDDYGQDEVTDLIAQSSGLYRNGFSLVLDGFNKQVLGSLVPDVPTIGFGGVTCRPSAPFTVFQFDNPAVPQRVIYNYDIHFDPPPTLGTFPTSGETPAEGDAAISVLGAAFPARTEFFFGAGADPYFSNVLPNLADPSAQNVPWLSQDLRVFTATPAMPGGRVPVPARSYVARSSPVPPGAPAFPESRPFGDYDTAGAYAYITELIGWLNQNYGDPSGVDPFDVSNSVLPGQVDAYTGDSSVSPGSGFLFSAFNNYNFAIARVRMRGTGGPEHAAPGVKVFFRLWQTQTADTDWDPGYTYLSDDPTGLNPQYPQAPSDDHTIPFFARGNYPVTNDAPNNQMITINQGDSQWSYFACYLNLYDGSFSVNGQSVQQQFAQGTHHCLVAQIAYVDAPIKNVNGNIETAENSDKLAQRNLQLTTSDNPGGPATHRIPQTFDVRPSAPPPPDAVDAVPDELMIDWGNTPPGSLAQIYWPGADALEVVDLASRMYGSQVLSVLDPHTISTETVAGVTFMPIPIGTGDSLAGLLTIDLPDTVRRGQQYDIVVRRFGTRNVELQQPPPRIAIKREPAGDEKRPASWERGQEPGVPGRGDPPSTIERYVIGTFQVKIPVQTKREMLPSEITTLAILKARLEKMELSNRWRPVLERYLKLIWERVDGLGGDAAGVPPSFLPRPVGEPGEHGGHGGGHSDEGHGGSHGAGDGRCHEEHAYLERTGKIVGLEFDHFGDFLGFVLDTGCQEHDYENREPATRTLAERVWSERLRVTVVSEFRDPKRVVRIIVREPPAAIL